MAKLHLNLKEITVFGMLAALMYASKIAMEAFPNIHLVSVFTVAITAVYRKKALFPLYVFVFMIGLFAGFNLWWIPYLYIWTVLWGMTMLAPQKLPERYKTIIYILICSAHGFLYGTLYAPAQAIMFGLNFEGMIAWIIAGLPFDLIHGVSNLFCGLLIMPIIKTLNHAKNYIS